MPRPCKRRCICHIPMFGHFGPLFINHPGKLEEIEMGLDELEALRLSDYEGLSQEVSASKMGVSRPTFGRILERARFKSAKALVNGLNVVITGGDHIMSQREFQCANCGHTFSVPFGVPRPSECPKCGSTSIHRIDTDRGAATTGRGRGPCGKGIGRFRGKKP
ncbi:MAG: DUF134 domain-containing protein [bacterium]